MPMPSDVTIRSECPADYAAIDEVNRLAFGQEAEARLVRALRSTAGFEPRMSLVAHGRGRVVGHILFSPVTIVGAAGGVPAVALAPMAVHPDYQRQGIGSRLVQEGLHACRRFGHAIVVVVGHPDYYPRFGFRPARAMGLEAPFPVPDEAFSAMALAAGALDGVSGMVEYPPPFHQV